MRRYSQRQNLSTLSEINITPLLDLAFVLLIIFMITTPLLESSMNLVIPSSGTKNPPINTSHVQTVSIDRTDTIPWLSYQKAAGHVVYGGRPLSPAPTNSGEGWTSAAFASWLRGSA